MARGRQRETAQLGMEIERPEPQEITVKATASQEMALVKVRFLKNWVYVGGSFRPGDKSELGTDLVQALEKAGAVERVN